MNRFDDYARQEPTWQQFLERDEQLARSAAARAARLDTAAEYPQPTSPTPQPAADYRD